MPKAISLSLTIRRARTIATILSLGEIILSPCSRYTKEGLVYIALASPLSWQPSLYLEYTKANIHSILDTKCAFFLRVRFLS